MQECCCDKETGGGCMCRSAVIKKQEGAVCAGVLL